MVLLIITSSLPKEIGMRILGFAFLAILLAIAGCSSEVKVIYPTDTVPPPRPEDIIGGGTSMPAVKSPAKPGK